MLDFLYSKNPSTGIVIGTFGSPGFIELQLATIRSMFGKEITVLVCDDNSNKSQELKSLCEEYGADFTSNDTRLGHQHGDLSVFGKGLLWAKERNIEILVKFSRRFLAFYDWKTELEDLVQITQFATYSSHCISNGFGFRSEVVAMHVPSWIGYGAPLILQARSTVAGGLFVEHYLHGVASGVHQDSQCSINKRYEDLLAQDGRVASSFGIWHIQGISRVLPRRGVLWHYSKPEEYLEKVNEFVPNKYKLSDFSRPNG